MSVPRRLVVCVPPLALLALVTLGACRAKGAAPASLTGTLAAERVELPGVAHAASGEPEPGALVIVASTSRVTLAGERYPVATLTQDGGAGLAPSDLRDGLFVVPIEEAVRWRADAGGAPEVVLAADARLPFRLAVSLLASASAAPLRLAARAPSGAIVTLPLARERLAVRKRLSRPGLWVRSSDAIEVHVEGALVPPCEAKSALAALAPCLAALAKVDRSLVTIGGGTDATVGELFAAIDLARAAGFAEVAITSGSTP